MSWIIVTLFQNRNFTRKMNESYWYWYDVITFIIYRQINLSECAIPFWQQQQQQQKFQRKLIKSVKCLRVFFFVLCVKVTTPLIFSISWDFVTFIVCRCHRRLQRVDERERYDGPAVEPANWHHFMRCIKVVISTDERICKNNHVNKSEKLILFVCASSLCDLCLMLFNCWFVFSALHCNKYGNLLFFSVSHSLSSFYHTLFACANNNQCEKIYVRIFMLVLGRLKILLYKLNCIESRDEKWMRRVKRTGDEIFHFHAQIRDERAI